MSAADVGLSGRALAGRLLWCTLLASTACADSGNEPRNEVLQLVDHEMWSQVSTGDDGPFAGNIGEACEAGGAVYEEPVFEINTDLCNGGTFTQPSLTPIIAGEVVHLVLWHLQLYAPEPAQAVMAVAIGDNVIYERSVPVPNNEAVYKPYVTVDEAYAEGAPVTIHVRNHGANSYKFLEFEVAAQEAFVNYEPEE